MQCHVLILQTIILTRLEVPAQYLQDQCLQQLQSINYHYILKTYSTVLKYLAHNTHHTVVHADINTVNM